jgi:hypothetical protein
MDNVKLGLITHSVILISLNLLFLILWSADHR